MRPARSSPSCSGRRTPKRPCLNTKPRLRRYAPEPRELKALRLARDAAAPPPEPAAPKRKAKKKGQGGSLSEFLDSQAKEGRNG